MKHKKFDLIIDKKVSSFQKTIEVDPDKSTSIRFFLIGSISQKISFGKNILESQDVHSCIKCLKKLGVKISKRKKYIFSIWKRFRFSFCKKKVNLNFGNSGTLARLIIGILSTTPNVQQLLKVIIL